MDNPGILIFPQIATKKSKRLVESCNFIKLQSAGQNLFLTTERSSVGVLISLNANAIRHVSSHKTNFKICFITKSPFLQLEWELELKVILLSYFNPTSRSRYPMEIHMVHFNSKYNNMTTAATMFDGVAILVIFFTLSTYDNPALSPILSQVPLIREFGKHDQIMMRKNWQLFWGKRW